MEHVPSENIHDLHAHAKTHHICHADFQTYSYGRMIHLSNCFLQVGVVCEGQVRQHEIRAADPAYFLNEESRGKEAPLSYSR